MRPKKPYRQRTPALLVALTTALVAAAPPAAATPTESGTRVPLKGFMRRCDGSQIRLGAPPMFGNEGTASAVIRATGGTVVADVQLVDTGALNAHFDVGLIQVPRPPGAPCGPGTPGTVYGSLDTDAAGRATTTLRDGIRPGTTGVWVLVQRPSAHSQDPINFYTSEFIAPV